jgi:hypothetical protein
MAKYNQGINGPFSGGVGEAVGSSWKGINYIRSYAAKISNPRSELQQDHRQKIAVTMKFLKPLTQFLRTGFKNYADQMTGINAAMSYNFHNALQGIYPNNALDYPKALVAHGNLAPALNQYAASTLAGTVFFNWDINSDEMGANSSDKTLLVVYNPEKNQAVTLSGLGNRADGAQSLTVPDSFSGDLVHCYLAFMSVDGEMLSNSSYAGAVTVA